MIEYIVIAAMIFLILLLIFAATRPNTFHVERSAIIHAPPEKIFPLINDFREWEPWSPWEKIDPEIKRTYSGALRGEGAIYEWSGNKNIGQGRMEIVESLPPFKIKLKIDFIKPFKAHNTIEFTLVPHGDSTTVTQAMYGPSPFVSRLMGIFCNMDKMIGRKYEEGLANLKTLSE
ncbi:SRPBCC family protein [Candidatus Methylomicrobium oryzae]|uniref:SRPBCC family protein n=1 Tax=Candidatus Methylomicrobium oryzae TaxID=2802053 RepID=UPI001920EF4B|nr:SRPBCC family protein [Methylomicrobium sp. RS1]MBL1262539.1 SRPBCC family protein [Methylomicrobium sp. RS1]